MLSYILCGLSNFNNSKQNIGPSNSEIIRGNLFSMAKEGEGFGTILILHVLMV